MRAIVRKLVTRSLALLLCLLPMAAQAQSLLGERLTMAFEAGRTIEVVVKLDLDDSLGRSASWCRKTYRPCCWR